jgi:hypothetical protein
MTGVAWKHLFPKIESDEMYFLINLKYLRDLLDRI